MEEILHAFGIDGRLIVIQIINFAILAGALWYFLYTPVLRLLAEREAKVKKGIEDAESATKALLEADSEKINIIKDARSEASQIVQKGTKHAEEKQKAMLDETSEKVRRQQELALAQAEDIKAQAIKASEAEIAKLAILGAEKVLGSELSK
jgi:F-type H+-transporting ATPase subunit b